MDGLAALLLTVAAAVAPNGHVLLPALAPPEVHESLPVDAFLPLTPRIWVVFHEIPEWPMAFYVPAGQTPPGADAPTPDLYLRMLAADPRIERLLPGLRVPRLFLYAPYYRHEGRLSPALEMPLDVAEYFFNALLEALFDLEPPEGIAARAAAHGPEVPEPQRRRAYLDAQAQFGAHALSVAVELRRSLARQRSAGKDPCRIVDRPGTLFGLWQRVFTTAEYRGLYRPPGAAAGRWVQGPALERRDKELFVKLVFGGFWTGDARRDFGLECPIAPTAIFGI